MPSKQRDFGSRVSGALADGHLSGALRKAQDQIRAKRDRALADLAEWQGFREGARAARSHAVGNLDTLLARFADNVERRGGSVFFAATAEEAAGYVASLAAKKKAKLIVKSKSMVTEEIHLNRALEAGGAEVVETDLGEYIIQLAHEKPSHIIIPAIHKTRAQVSEIFSAVAGRKLSDESAALTRFAREELRKKFLAADMGISGCNFAVASTGSIVLLSNEGNARLATSLPPVHVAVMGLERIVADWASLDPLLSLLPRSATGQRTTTYVTAITGPRRRGDVEGPEELHVVIVDNGRSNLLGTKYSEVLNCIRCGACLNVCPVYRHIGGHAYGGVYSGPIGVLTDALLENAGRDPDLPFASTLCGACQEVCPAKVPIADLLVELRNDTSARGERPLAERAAFAAFGAAASRPRLFGAAARAAAGAVRLLARNGFVEKGVGPLSRWTRDRSFPAPPRTSFTGWWRGSERGRTGG